MLFALQKGFDWMTHIKSCRSSARYKQKTLRVSFGGQDFMFQGALLEISPSALTMLNLEY